MSDLDLVRGTLDILVLKSLSGGPMHGYSVARWIKHASDDALLVEEGALYPSLHRMERKGWVEAEWGVSENNRRAKYYRLTTRGRQALGQETTAWDRYVAAVTKVMASEPRPA